MSGLGWENLILLFPMLVPCSSCERSEVKVGKVAPKYVPSIETVHSAGVRFHQPCHIRAVLLCARVRSDCRHKHTIYL